MTTTVTAVAEDAGATGILTLRHPPARPLFTGLVLMGAFAASVLLGIVVAGDGAAALVVLGAVWILVAVTCGLRPIWDADYRAEGGRLAHVAWFFRLECGLAGVAAPVLPVVVVLAIMTGQSRDWTWFAVNLGVAVIAAGVIAWYAPRGGWRGVVVGVLLGLMIPVIAIAGYLLLFVVVYVGPVAAVVYLACAGAAWIVLRRKESV